MAQSYAYGTDVGNVLKYEVWEGARNFWCKGKLQTGPNTRNLVIVSVLIQITNGLSLGFSWFVSLPYSSRMCQFIPFFLFRITL